MSQHGGYSLPVLHHGRRGLFGFGEDAPTHNAVILAHSAPGGPPIHKTPPATSGDPYTIVKLPEDVQEPLIHLKPTPAVAQIRSWISGQPWDRIQNAYIQTPPGHLQTGYPSLDATRQFEQTMGVQFGPQDALVDWLSGLEAALLSSGMTYADPGKPPRLVLPVRAIEEWATDAPSLIGPDALADPTYTRLIVDAQKLAWFLRQVKRLRGVSLERRLLSTGSGADWAWIFADEGVANLIGGSSSGYVQRVRAVLAPPVGPFNALLLPVLRGAYDLEERLAMARAAPGVPPKGAGVVAFSGKMLLGAGLAFTAYWLWTRSRRRGGSAAAALPALDFGGGGGGGAAGGAAPAESFLPALVTD